MTGTAEIDRTIDLGDKALAYLDMGSGPCVIIVHGVGGHKEDWFEIAQALSSSYRVLAVDMLGFGGSSKTGDDLSMAVQAAALAALLDRLEIQAAAVVGNSVGGWVAATFGATYPQRTRRLVLIDPAGFKAMFEGEPPVNFDPDSPAEMQALIEMVINDPARRPPGLAERAYRAYVDSGEKAISALWGKSMFVSTRLEELFPKISAPTAFLWGVDDKLFPSVLATIFQPRLRGSTVQLIPGAGHFPHIDQPALTLAAIREALGSGG